MQWAGILAKHELTETVVTTRQTLVCMAAGRGGWLDNWRMALIVIPHTAAAEELPTPRSGRNFEAGLEVYHAGFLLYTHESTRNRLKACTSRHAIARYSSGFSATFWSSPAERRYKRKVAELYASAQIAHAQRSVEQQVDKHGA